MSGELKLSNHYLDHIFMDKDYFYWKVAQVDIYRGRCLLVAMNGSRSQQWMKFTKMVRLTWVTAKQIRECCELYASRLAGRIYRSLILENCMPDHSASLASSPSVHSILGHDKESGLAQLRLEYDRGHALYTVAAGMRLHGVVSVLGGIGVLLLTKEGEPVFHALGFCAGRCAKVEVAGVEVEDFNWEAHACHLKRN